MVIFNITGGLGNQFFQYAFGRYLSIKNHSELHVNIRSYEMEANRDFKLPYYKTSYKIKTEQEVLDYISFYMSLRPVLKRYYRKMWPLSMKKYFEHLGNEFDTSFKKARRGYFYGYWGHEEYFREIESVIRKDLVLRNEYSNKKLMELKEGIGKVNSVAIHIRRGDYIDHPVYSKIFNSLPLTYYKNAVERMVTLVKDPVFYVFADDYAWVRANLQLPVNDIRFGEDFGFKKDYLEFELMRSCRHFIIANSTFSWWAAWLADYHNKQVITPRDWYKEQQLNNVKTLPEGWLKV